jgi:hypothetical protein
MTGRRGAVVAVLLSASFAGCGVLVGLTGDYRDVSGGHGGAGGTGGAGVGGATSGSGATGLGGNGGNGGQGGAPQCPANATCMPGESKPCGNCGTRTCELPSCTFGACQNEGVCKPGTKQDCPNGCSQRLCLDTCAWCGCNGTCGNCSPSITNPWLGCGGTGCAICPSEVMDYPCYFENHPGCVPEVACDASMSECSDSCPPPSAADMCTCAAPPQGWHGCGSSGCDVCSSQVAAYACYFYNHPQCGKDDACGGGPGKCSDHCPQPSSADLPSMN